MKKLLILDSNSILNRAFYGVRYLSAKDRYSDKCDIWFS